MENHTFVLPGDFNICCRTSEFAVGLQNLPEDFRIFQNTWKFNTYFLADYLTVKGVLFKKYYNFKHFITL